MRIANVTHRFVMLRRWVAAVLLLGASMCHAHPMGNFSVSHYSAITLDRNKVEVLYIIDMAEIPTFQAMQQSGLTGTQDDKQLASFLLGRATEFGSGLHLSVEGQELQLEPATQSAVFSPGAGGLPTMKSVFLYRAKLAQKCNSVSCKLVYEDTNFPGRAGWKEIVIHSAPGLTIQRSTAPDHDRSSMLTNYSADLTNAVLQELNAEVIFSIGAPTSGAAPSLSLKHDLQRSGAPTQRSAEMPKAASSHASPKLAPVVQNTGAVAPSAHATPRGKFTELIAAQHVGFGMALFAALIAAGLGALHALEPGHGKTIVAAYLVGAKGTARHAVLLGTIVTITHTAGVYLLGAVTLYAQQYILPERLFPILGVLSGILIAGMGLYLLLQRLAGAELLHTHAGGEGTHRHFGFAHTHLPFRPTGAEGEPVAFCADRNPSVQLHQLLVLGITGGIVPCPAALVVLLSALALRRVAFGLLLIVSFSAGLAVVLIAMGMLAVYAGRWIARVRAEGPLMQRWLPLASAGMMTALGCAIALQSLMTAGVFPLHA